MQFSSSSKDVSPVFKPTIAFAQLWNQRFCHASFTVLKHLSFFSNMFPNKSHCDICPLAKEQCLPFPSSSIHTLSLFESIHVDLWGPYHHECLSGAWFMVTIVDDYSRATWTYLISNKSQALIILTSFAQMASVHFHNQYCLSILSCLTWDSPSEELCVYSSKKWCRRTQAQAPAQLARALLFQSQLPKIFYDHALFMAIHLENRLRSSLLSWKTPYEVLYGHPPGCTSLRCFGYLCSATNIKPHKDKFSLRDSKCVFLGFQPGMKAYKVYDLHSHTIFHSRDVVFVETIFPFFSSFPLLLSSPSPTFLFSLPDELSSSPPHALFLFLLEVALFLFLLLLLPQLLLILPLLHSLFLLPLLLLFLPKLGIPLLGYRIS